MVIPDAAVCDESLLTDVILLLTSKKQKLINT